MKNTSYIFSTFLVIFLSGLFLFTYTSCSSHDDYLGLVEVPEGEHEEASQLVLNFQDTASGQTRSFVYEVPEGSSESVTTEISDLKAGVYNVSIQFFGADGEELTDDIFGHDKDEHFVYYSKLNNSNIQIVYADDDARDSDNNKLGQKTIWTVSEGKSTQLVYLIHQPAVKDPDALSTEQLGGEIDLEAHFVVTANK